MKERIQNLQNQYRTTKFSLLRLQKKFLCKENDTVVDAQENATLLQIVTTAC